MREFEYFLYENFDADKEAGNPHNPRNYFGSDTDAVLSSVATYPEDAGSYFECCDKFGPRFIGQLCDVGILRHYKEGLAFDCPIFLREDAAVLNRLLKSKAAVLTDMLESGMTEIRSHCARVENGFSVERNLYHILCGMVFDGYFFDYLSEKGTLSVSRKHGTGLDYITIIYEKCNELHILSDGLLCSYNRLVSEKCSLQSFGDAGGERFDFYRFFRLLEKGALTAEFKDAEKMLHNLKTAYKDTILYETVSFIKNGQCDLNVKRLLEHFGYIKNEKVCVPVYLSEHQKYILGIKDIVESLLGEEMSDTLIELAGDMDITAAKHGVSRFETANELYHIIFGFINEELVSRNIVSAPENIPGEGRYFKCIEIY